MGFPIPGAVQIKDGLDVVVNPATEEKQDDIIAAINASGGEGTVSDVNSSSTPLGSGAVFTGTSVETLRYSVIVVSVFSDKGSATDGLEIQQSVDDTNWDHTDCFTIPASTGKTFTFQPSAKYLRVVYTNGVDAQNSFRLQTTLKISYVKPSSHRIQDAIVSEDDAELTKAVITGLKDDGSFDNCSLTNKGQFKVSVEEYGDTPSVDAFARLRVSENFTIFDSKQLHDKQPLFWDESLGGSATSTHVPADADVEMVVTASASDFVIRQTKQRFNYQPGKSQLLFMTFRSPQGTGITSRIGCFDGTGANNLTPNNGIFFECDGTLSWNIAKNGSTTETVSQSSWNVDKLDGTGASGITLDLDAPQILIIDYEWLGVGRVRVGFVIDGLTYYCHYFNHSNDDTFDSVYMSTPNLPLRYSIESDGSGTGELDHICSTVISEGGIEKTGVLRSIDSGDAFITGYTTGNSYALLGIRLKTTYNDVTVIPEAVNIVIGSSDSYKWELQLNPTVAGTFTYGDLANSSIQSATGGTANTITTDGLIIASGGGSTQTRTTQADLETALRIGSTIAGTADELVLVFRPLSAHVSQWSSINFRELL